MFLIILYMDMWLTCFTLSLEVILILFLTSLTALFFVAQFGSSWYQKNVLRISNPSVEGTLCVSKWIKIQVLLDLSEMEELIRHLQPFYCLDTSRVVSSFEHDFLEDYKLYLKDLKTPVRSCIWTTSLDPLYAMKVGEDKYLIKSLLPTIQIQAHQFFYSDLDKKFHPMVLSKESISWGIQFSYPQLYQDPKTQAFHKCSDLPNTQLFLKLTKWLREYSCPTPFMAEGKKVHVPIRIGLKVFSWIKDHPQLKARGLEVCHR